MPSAVIQSVGIESAQGAAEQMAVTVNINMCPFFSGSGCSFTWLTTKMKPVGKIFRGEQTSTSAVQLVFGILCFACGGIIFSNTDMGNYMELWYSEIIMTRAPFWTGALFLGSGIITIISEKFPVRCWVLLALLMNLTSTCAAIAGIVICAQQLSHGFNYYYVSSEQYYESFAKLKKSVFILFLVIICFELCITLYSVGYALKTICCSKPSEQDENVVLEDPVNESKSESNLLSSKQELQSLLDI